MSPESSVEASDSQWNELWRFVRFAVVGGAIFALDFALIRLFLFVFPPLLTVGCSYLIAVSVHFLLSKFWVYRAGGKILVREVVQYAAVALIAALVTTVICWIALRFLTENVYLAKCVAIPPTLFLSFILLKRFAFAPRDGV